MFIWRFNTCKVNILWLRKNALHLHSMRNEFTPYFLVSFMQFKRSTFYFQNARSRVLAPSALSDMRARRYDSLNGTGNRFVLLDGCAVKLECDNWDDIYICPATGHWNLIWSLTFPMFRQRRESCALPVYIETHCSDTVERRVNVDARYPRVWVQTLISQADKLDMWQTSERNAQERFTNLTQNDKYRSYKPFKETNWNACLRLWNCVILHVGFLIHQISKALMTFWLLVFCPFW